MSVRKITNKAKKVGKAANKVLESYPGLSMVPYIPQAVKAANTLVKVGDTFADLMEAFGIGSSVGHPGAPYGQVAGVANGVTVSRSAPKIRGSKGSIRITHKELVTPVANSTTINVSQRMASGQSVYQVNASGAILFPWLSKIAASYDYYRFKRLRLVYVPICATTETGRVMLGYDPDSTDPIQVDRQNLAAYACSVEGSAWATQVLDCALSDTAKWYYNDTLSTSVNNFGPMLDQGQVFTASWSGGTNNTVGELYVLYDVELKDPQPNNALVVASNGSGASFTNIFPTTFPVFNMPGTANSIVFLCTGSGTFSLFWSCASTAVSAPTITAGGSIVVARQSTDGTNTRGYVIVAATATCTLTLPGLTSLAGWEAYAIAAGPQGVY